MISDEEAEREAWGLQPGVWRDYRDLFGQGFRAGLAHARKEAGHLLPDETALEFSASCATDILCGALGPHHGRGNVVAHARKAAERIAALERCVEAAYRWHNGEGDDRGNAARHEFLRIRRALKCELTVDALQDSGGSGSDHSCPVSLAREGRAGAAESEPEPAGLSIVTGPPLRFDSKRIAALERVAEAARDVAIHTSGEYGNLLRHALRALDALQSSGGSGSAGTDAGNHPDPTPSGYGNDQPAQPEPASLPVAVEPPRFDAKGAIELENDEAIVDELVAKRTAELQVHRYLTRKDLARLACLAGQYLGWHDDQARVALRALADAAEGDDE